MLFNPFTPYRMFILTMDYSMVFELDALALVKAQSDSSLRKPKGMLALVCKGVRTISKP